MAVVTPQRSLEEQFPRLLHGGGPRGWTRELESVRSQARAFADGHLRPRALEIDRRCAEDPSYFDWGLVRAGAEHGMIRVLTPAPAGGTGGAATHSSVAMEELFAACPGIGLIFGANALGVAPLLFSVSHWYGVLAEQVAAERTDAPQLIACAVTEPEAGSDMENPDLLARARMSSQARRVPGGFRLTTAKRFISNGTVARWLTVIMSTDPRRPVETMTCFLVDARSEGFRVSRLEHKMGQRACPAAEIVLDEVFVPDEHVVGREGGGVSAILIVLACSRPVVGAIATGIARGAYERVLAWLEEDPAAKGLLDREHVQLELAAMEEDIHVARQAYMDAATEVDVAALGGVQSHPMVRSLDYVPASLSRRARMRGLLRSDLMRDIVSGVLHQTVDDRELTRSLALASLAQARAADVAMRVTGAALELVGLRAGPVRAELEKLWRDAKLTQIYEGTNQLNRLDVYRGLSHGETHPLLPAPPRRAWLRWPS
jgi:alkylation response protein AidB-like acyl-CoA dehydrogenase